VLVGSLLPTNTRHCHQHGVTITRSCIDTICFSCVVRDITCNREESIKSEAVTARPSDKGRLKARLNDGKVKDSGPF